MLSRVANSVYWMNRYVERAENVARFIDVNYNLTIGEPDKLGNQWAPLVYITGDHQPYQQRYETATRENVLHFLSFDEENPNSILSCVAGARENARQIRDVIPTVVWEQINRFHLMVLAASRAAGTLDQPQQFCEDVRSASHLIVGATDATMSHGEPWHFASMGRHLERADKTSRIVDVQYYLLLPDAADVGTALDVVRWSALLNSASALAMYRRHWGKIVPELVADFLILNRHFPRAVQFCLNAAQESLHEITGNPLGTFGNRAEQFLGRLCANMNYASIKDIIQHGMHEYIDAFQQQLNLVGEAICEEFFTSYEMKRLRQKVESSIHQPESTSSPHASGSSQRQTQSQSQSSSTKSQTSQNS